jgi:hypothetical protein
MVWQSAESYRSEKVRWEHTKLSFTAKFIGTYLGPVSTTPIKYLITISAAPISVRLCQSQNAVHRNSNRLIVIKYLIGVGATGP